MHPGGRHRLGQVDLLNTPLITDLIYKGEVGEIKEVIKKSRNLGMQTFDQALFDLFETNMGTKRLRFGECKPLVFVPKTGECLRLSRF